MSGLISAQLYSPHLSISIRVRLLSMGMGIWVLNSPPLTYGNCVILFGKDARICLSSIAIISNIPSKNSARSVPSAFVSCLIAVVNIFAQGNRPVSSAKKQNNKRVINTLMLWICCLSCTSLYRLMSSYIFAIISADFTSASDSSMLRNFSIPANGLKNSKSFHISEISLSYKSSSLGSYAIMRLPSEATYKRGSFL